MISASASNLLKNVASIGFVLLIMRFDTVQTLVNRYGMPDFAQFAQMETKKMKHFSAVWFINELILNKATKQQKVCARNVSNLFMSQ